MSDIKTVIANRLRQCRRSKDWTIEETAKRLGVTGSRYSNWEQAIRTPKYEQLIALADVYGTTPSWLAGFTDHEGNSPDALNFVTVGQSTISVKDAVLTLEQVADTSAFKIDYIKRRGLNENKLTSIIAPDNSMSDIIKEGDEVLIDRSRTTANVADVFAILVNGRVWIRWIRPELDGSITVAAEDSSHYPDQNLNAEQFDKLKIIGRVARISRDR